MEPHSWAALIDEAEKGIVEGKTDKKLMFRLAVADGIMAELRFFKPPPFPDRPATVPDDDNEVWASVFRSRKARAAMEDVQLAQAFVRWREEVVAAEAKSRANLLLLLDTLDSYDAVVEAGGDNDAIASKRAALAEHVERYWGKPVEELLEGDRVERDRRAGCLCRRAEIMPTWLVNGDPPPRFVPSAYRLPDEEEEG